MGQERQCTLRHGGRTDSGKALLETDYLLFRGERRLKLPFKDLTDVKAADGCLHLQFSGGTAVLALGDAAVKWAEKILHPPSRLDKLGIKAGTKLRILGEMDPNFVQEAKAAGAVMSDAIPDLVFFGANTRADLDGLPKLAASLPPGAALWVVYPKRVQAIREIDVIQAGRASGCKDTKVVGFSASHTALKFTAPRQ